MKNDDSFKVNSNTISLGSEDYSRIEKILKKVASDNNINGVSSIDIILSEDSGIVGFKTASFEGVISDLEHICNTAYRDIEKLVNSYMKDPEIDVEVKEEIKTKLSNFSEDIQNLISIDNNKELL